MAEFNNALEKVAMIAADGRSESFALLVLSIAMLREMDRCGGDGKRAIGEAKKLLSSQQGKSSRLDPFSQIERIERLYRK